MTEQVRYDGDLRWAHGDEPAPPIRVAVSGAAGHVGYGLAFQIASGALFGYRQAVSLSLLEAPAAINKLKAMRLELHDCAFPLLDEVVLSDDPQEAFAGADWIVMLAGHPYVPDLNSRMDMVRANGPIYVEHGRAINTVAPTARMLVVAQPCNTTCRVAMKHAPNVAAERWFALNRLDRMRATSLIAEKARVPLTRVNRVTVWGNRSEKIYVDFHNAFIGDKPAHQVIQDPEWPRKVLEPTVGRREQSLFDLSGALPAGTATQAILGTIRSLITPTPPGRRFGAAVHSDGSYGVPSGLVFGFPLRTEDGKTWSIVEDLYMDEYADSRLEENIEELERESVVAAI